MINLKSEPSLGSMVLTRDAVWKYTYTLPIGMEFPVGSTAQAVATTRTGAEIARFDATLDTTTALFLEQPEDLADIPAGANFEVFLDIPSEGVFKVLYGRVVRREVSFPGTPVSSEVYNAAIYTDNVGNRASLGPYWVQKYGKTILHDNSASGKPYGMGNDSILWDKSATHWYAPLRSDTVKVNVSVMKPPSFGGGSITVVLSSNYAMTNWMGVKFDCDANTVRPVTGTTTGPTAIVNQGSTVANTVSTSPDPYTLFFHHPTNTLSLYKGASTTALLTWVDASNLVLHGEGHRYTGIIYIGGLLSVGPQLTNWAAKDDL